MEENMYECLCLHTHAHIHIERVYILYIEYFYLKMNKREEAK